MSFADQYAEAAIEYAKSDKKRFYPGGQHSLNFDDPTLGKLLHEYHTNATEDNHNALLSHLHSTQPVARQTLDYMNQVGGPIEKPRIVAYTSRGRRNPITSDYEDDRGELQLSHHENHSGGSLDNWLDDGGAAASHELHLSISHPHAGQMYTYKMAIPNLHPEQLTPTRSPGQRRAAERMMTAPKRKV